MRVLAGDVGGTHARLALFEAASGADLELVDESTVPSAGYTGLAPIVSEFLAERRLSGEEDLDGVCIAVAGPGRGGVFQLPNLGWTLELERFRADIGFPHAELINDFEAIGNGVPLLRPEDRGVIQEGTPTERGTVAIVGPGTGLGHGFLIWEGDGYRVHPSEGGHADFAPQTASEWALAEFVRKRHGHASWERVVSGPGLVEIYRFLASEDGASESPAVHHALAGGGGAEVISRHGVDGSDALCTRALDVFASVLGGLAGNLALTLEAYGGVYIAGGIAPQILEQLQAGSFLERFRKKGRLSRLLDSIPVYVILDDRIGLQGAARVAAGAS